MAVSRGYKSLAAAPFLLAMAADLPAADLNGYAVLTTDYVFRGVTQSKGSGAVQLGLELSFDNGLYLGAWGSTVDIDNGPAQHRDTETDYYLGYAWEASPRWTLGANVVAYKYPGADTTFDYDYVEYSLSANYNDRYWFEYAFSPDLYHSGYKTHNYELAGEWPLAGNWFGSAAAGYYDTSGLTGAGYGYWQAGVTGQFGRFDVDLRYHDTNRPVRIISTNDTADSRVALSVRVSF